jgi:predicted small secreted protein
MLKRVALLTFILGALAGCQTIDGMGEDIEHAGDHIEDATDS